MTPAPNALLTPFTPASASALIYDFSNGFLSTGPAKLLLAQNIPPSKSCPSSIPSPSRARGLLRAEERTFKGLPLSSAGSDPKRTHIHTHRALIKGLVEAHKEGSKPFPKSSGGSVVVSPSFCCCTWTTGFYLSGGISGSPTKLTENPSTTPSLGSFFSLNLKARETLRNACAGESITHRGTFWVP